MSDEELRRVMEFIVKRQENFAEGMEQMREEARQRQAEAEERFKGLERASLNLYNAMTELTSAHGGWQGKWSNWARRRNGSPKRKRIPTSASTR